MKIETPKANALVILNGLALAAMAAGSQVPHDAMLTAGLGGALSWLSGVLGNQAHSWATKPADLPPDSEEIYRNHDIQRLVEGAIRSALEMVEKPANPQAAAALNEAIKTFPVVIGKEIENPNSPLNELGEFDIPDLLTKFASQEGNVTLFTVEVWDGLLSQHTQLWTLERRQAAEQLHKTLAKSLWGHVKRDAAEDGKGFAAIELLYLSRILDAVERTHAPDAPDMTALESRMDDLIERLDAKQSRWFERLWTQNERHQEANAAAHGKAHRLLQLVLKKLARLEAGTQRAAVPHQISAPPRDFVGREDELRELAEGIEQGGVTISGLHGAGGIGKTALALKLAEQLKARYPDADLYLDLRGVQANPATAVEALQHFIRAFHPTAQLPDNVPQLRPLYLSVLHEQRAIVLLDNARDRAQVEPLLPPPSCAVIVTSRRHFRVGDLNFKHLGALPEDKAVELLLKIAAHIGECAPLLARRLSCLPFALELAAAHLQGRPNLAPESYLSLLADVLARPEMGPVEASLKLSYDVLDAAAQTRWRMLSVFPDTFDDAAAAALWQMSPDAASEVLGDLFALSMVEWNETTRRHRLHDLARDFAAARLNEDQSEAYTAQKRHAAHFRIVLARADDLFLEGNEAILRGLKLFDAERANIETGQSWAATHAAQDGEAARLCMSYPDAGVYVLSLRQPPRARIAWLEAALAAARQLKERQSEGNALGNLGLAYAALGETRRAIEYHEQLLVIAREISDRRGEGAALGNLGIAYAALGETRRAIEYYEQLLVIAREISDRRGEGAALGNLGLAYADLGETRRAIEYYEQALIIDREIGDRRGEGAALCNLGLAYADLGETRRAIEYHEQDLAIAREIGDRRGEGNALGNLGLAYAALGETRRAIEYYEQHLAIAREIGDRRGEGNALGNLGNAYAALGETRRAIEYHEQALIVTQEIGDKRAQGSILGNLGLAYADLGEMQRAIEYYEQHLAIAREIGDRRGEGTDLFNMSLALESLGERARAVELAQAALTIFEAIESPNAPMVRRTLEEWRAE